MFMYRDISSLVKSSSIYHRNTRLVCYVTTLIDTCWIVYEDPIGSSHSWRGNIVLPKERLVIIMKTTLQTCVHPLQVSQTHMPSIYVFFMSSFLSLFKIWRNIFRVHLVVNESTITYILVIIVIQFTIHPPL